MQLSLLFQKREMYRANKRYISLLKWDINSFKNWNACYVRGKGRKGAESNVLHGRGN